mgnify:CR=1 FL=1
MFLLLDSLLKSKLTNWTFNLEVSTDEKYSFEAKLNRKSDLVNFKSLTIDSETSFSFCYMKSASSVIPNKSQKLEIFVV